MRPLPPLSPSILALCFSLLAPVAQAEPQVQIRLNGQALQATWEPLAGDRFATELELLPGTLQLGSGKADHEPLKPFPRHELRTESRFDFTVAEPGRYPLLVQRGEDTNLRLLPVRQEKQPAEYAALTPLRSVPHLPSSGWSRQPPATVRTSIGRGLAP